MLLLLALRFTVFISSPLLLMADYCRIESQGKGLQWIFAKYPPNLTYLEEHDGKVSDKDATAICKVLDDAVNAKPKQEVP